METFLKWRSSGLKNENGIIVGADISQEWLLPWWWTRYAQHNSMPVAFVDFGMSFQKKAWCKERGELIPLRVFADFVKEASEIDPDTLRAWERECGTHIWGCRAAWFKKPLAFLQTPFQTTLWLDLDCEIRGSVDPLLCHADNPSGIGIALDQHEWPPGVSYPMFNTGVVAFRRGAEAIIEWANRCIQESHLFIGDQEVFSHQINEKKIPVSEISPLYNWSRMREENREALILHWHGNHGKTVIRHQINVEELPK
ncbi:MAG: hypothetical protein WCF19_04665 [Chlamydiales bacterium]